MTLREALATIGFEPMTENFPQGWADAPFIPTADDLVLEEHAVRRNAQFCSLPPDVTEKMVAAAGTAVAEPALYLIARAVFRAIFLSAPEAPVRWAWQPLDSALKDQAGALYLAIAAGWVPLMLRHHQKLGISEDVTRDTCYQLRCYCDNYFTGCGRIGIYPQQLSWMHNYFNPERPYVRLGRFEYCYRIHCYDGHVFRHRKTGETVFFAIPGMQFDAAGFAVESKPDSPERAFASIYESNGVTATGNRVDDCGKTSPEPFTITLADYDVVLEMGMPVLDMHIPNGGGMTPDEAERSFRMAKEFFLKLYPEKEKQPVAIVCSSWIFNPNLPEILNPEANLVRLLKRVHPVPRPSSNTDGLWFIFRHEGAFELLKAPRKTSLQRAVTHFIERGGRWRIGGMVLPFFEI